MLLIIITLDKKSSNN